MWLLELPEVVLPEAAERLAAWEKRCSVSHVDAFVPMRLDGVVFAPPVKPVRDLRVALASSGGVHIVGQSPFDLASHHGDDSVRWIPAEVDVKDLRFTDDHYDHGDADSDPNCMFPLERLRELVSEGVAGSIAPRHLGFMGFVPDPTRFVGEVLPVVVETFKEDGVDAVIFGPGCPMCHRTVAFAQHALESAGIATVSVTLAPSLTLGFGVPRALHVRFPFGNAFGEPHDRWTQRAVLKALMGWIEHAPGPNAVRRLPYSWSHRAVPEDQEDCVDGACFVPRLASSSRRGSI